MTTQGGFSTEAIVRYMLEAGRVLAVLAALPPNTFQGGVGLAGIGALGVFNQLRYTALIKGFFQTEINSGFILPRSLLPARRHVLNLLNIKYVVTHRATPAQKAALLEAGLTEENVDGNFTVYRNGALWPRAFVAHDFAMVTDAAAAVAAVATAGTPDRVILEEPPGFAPVSVPADAASITNYEPNRFAISGDAAQPGMLVLLDAFGPGWSARMNGQPAPIVPVNAAFRGVEVAAGRWQVTMEYETPLFRPGLITTLAALATAGATSSFGATATVCGTRSTPPGASRSPDGASAATSPLAGCRGLRNKGTRHKARPSDSRPTRHEQVVQAEFKPPQPHLAEADAFEHPHERWCRDPFLMLIGLHVGAHDAQALKNIQQAIDGGVGPRQDECAARRQHAKRLAQHGCGIDEVLQHGEHHDVVEAGVRHGQTGRDIRHDLEPGC